MTPRLALRYYRMIGTGTEYRMPQNTRRERTPFSRPAMLIDKRRWLTMQHKRTNPNPTSI